MSGYPLFFHRGLNRQAPENTFASFQKAVDCGARWIETDTDIIKDGTPIIMHDSKLDRTTDHSGSIYDITADDLETIDAGSWFGEEFTGERIPTLYQLIDFINEHDLNVNLELKPNEQGMARSIQFVETVIDALSAVKPGVEILVCSFSPLLLAEFHKRCDKYRIGLNITKAGADWRSVLEMCGASVIGPNWMHTTPEQVREMRDAGYEVSAWPCNDIRDTNRAINWGYNSFCSDVPDQMMHVCGLDRPTHYGD